MQLVATITRMPRHLFSALVLALAIAGPARPPRAQSATADRQPDATVISDAEFWRLVTDLSEPGGVFAQQLMSNEDSAQFVIPDLERAVRPGGVYLGVGSEQNFTYAAALQPQLAFVIDIRRDNLVEML